MNTRHFVLVTFFVFVGVTTLQKLWAADDPSYNFYFYPSNNKKPIGPPKPASLTELKSNPTVQSQTVEKKAEEPNPYNRKSVLPKHDESIDFKLTIQYENWIKKSSTKNEKNEKNGFEGGEIGIEIGPRNSFYALTGSYMKGRAKYVVPKGAYGFKGNKETYIETEQSTGFSAGLKLKYNYFPGLTTFLHAEYSKFEGEAKIDPFQYPLSKQNHDSYETVDTGLSYTLGVEYTKKSIGLGIGYVLGQRKAIVHTYSGGARSANIEYNPKGLHTHISYRF